MRIVVAAVLSAIMLLGCASSGGDRAAEPSVAIRQTSVLRPIRAAFSSQVPVEYAVAVTNPLETPVTLLSLEIETIGYSGSYTMKRVKHAFTHVIAPGATETLSIRAWVQPLQESTRGEIVAPVSIRGYARFDSDGRTVRTLFASRVDERQ